MSPSCPHRRDVLRLLDGELTRNEEGTVRAHLASCGECRAEEASLALLVADLGAPIAGLPSEGATARVMDRIRGGDLPQHGPAASRSWGTRGRLGRAGLRRLVGVAGLFAAAAAITLVIGARGPAREEAFQARGGAPSPSLARSVGVMIYAPLAEHRLLASGDRVAASAAYTAAYRNLDRERPVHLLVFAVDALGELHWLYPAYTARTSDPASLRLPFAADETPLPESVVLEDVAPGALRLVTLVTREALHVSAIEALPKAELALPALSARFAGGHVEEVRVTVGERAGAR